MKLSELRENEFAKITEVKECSAGKRRLNDLGFCENEPVNCVFKGAFGSIGAYRVKDTVIALRKSDSDNIEVEI